MDSCGTSLLENDVTWLQRLVRQLLLKKTSHDIGTRVTKLTMIKTVQQGNEFDCGIHNLEFFQALIDSADGCDLSIVIDRIQDIVSTYIITYINLRRKRYYNIIKLLLEQNTISVNQTIPRSTNLNKNLIKISQKLQIEEPSTSTPIKRSHRDIRQADRKLSEPFPGFSKHEIEQDLDNNAELDDEMQNVSIQIEQLVHNMSMDEIIEPAQLNNSKDILNETVYDDPKFTGPRLILKPDPAMSIEEINNAYPDAANFIKKLGHLRHGRMELIDAKNVENFLNAKKFFRHSLFNETDYANKGSGEDDHGCPFQECQFHAHRLNVEHHVKRYHYYEKWMCPIGLCRHVVPIIAVDKKTIQIHIQEAHRNKTLEPIRIHSKQIKFPFTMPYKNSAEKLKAAELCFVDQRRAAKEYILRNGIQEIEGSEWLTTAHIADRLKKEIPKMLRGKEADINLANEPLYDVEEEEVTQATKNTKYDFKMLYVCQMKFK